jgi:hypothetical protein
VGQAVTGVALPRFMSKAAPAAVGATLDTTMRPPRTVRIDWADGKQSLIKLPDKLVTHLALILKSRQTAIVEPTPAAVEAGPAPVASLSVTEQALTHLSGLLKDRYPRRSRAPLRFSHRRRRPNPMSQSSLLSLLRCGTLELSPKTSSQRRSLNCWRASDSRGSLGWPPQLLFSMD